MKKYYSFIIHHYSLIILLILVILGGGWYFQDSLKKFPLFSSLFGGFQQEAVVPTLGLVAYYPMERDGNTLYDKSRNSNNGTISGATSVPGKKGTALSFDGEDDYVNIGDVDIANFGTADFSIGFWIKSDEASWADILAKSNWSYSTLSEGWVITWRPDVSDGWIYFTHTDFDNKVYWSNLSQYFDNKWHYFSFSADRSAGTIELFVDGVSKGTKSPPDFTSQNITSSSNFYIAKSPSGREIRGSIDEVRIYDRVLTTEEITALYREGTETIGGGEKGLIAHYSLDSENETHGSNVITNGDFENGTTGWSGSVDTTISAETGGRTGNLLKVLQDNSNSAYGYQSFTTVVGKKYRATVWNKRGTATDGRIRIGTTYANGDIYTSSIFQNTDWTQYTVDFIATSGTTYVTGQSYASTGHYQYFDDISVYEFQTADQTPNGNNGSLYPGASAGYVTDQKGQAGKAYDFDGTATKVVLPNSFDGYPLTISFWVKPENINSAKILAYLYFGASNWFACGFSSSIGFTTQSSDIGASIDNFSLDTWKHVTLTFSAQNTGNIYVNGVDVTSAGVNSWGEEGTESALGARNSGNYFDGAISDVKIFNRVLSVAEVQKLYNAYDAEVSINGLAKGLVGHWELTNKWVNGTDIQDLTPNNNNGTASSVTVGGRGSLFDGADSEIPTTLTDNTAFQNGFTIGAWINPYSLGESNGRIVAKDESASATKGFSFMVYTGNRLLFIVDEGSNAQSAPSSITLGSWQHVIVTVTSGGTASFYINGVSSGSDSVLALSHIETSNPVTIGNRSSAIDPDRTFDGLISDVRLYNHVLSTDEITQLYNMGRPRPAQRAASLNGSTQYFLLADTGSAGSAEDFDMGTDDFAVEFWVKTSQSDVFSYLLSKTAGAGSHGWGASFASATNKLRFEIYPTDGTSHNIYSNSTINDNAWHHVFVSADRDGSLKLFVDGVLQDDTADISSESNLSVATTYALSFGSYFNGNDKFTGQLDAVRIYNFGVSGLPTNIAHVAQYNSETVGRIHPDIASSLVDAWDFDGDSWARNESSHNLTNYGSTPYIKP